MSICSDGSLVGRIWTKFFKLTYEFDIDIHST